MSWMKRTSGQLLTLGKRIQTILRRGEVQIDTSPSKRSGLLLIFCTYLVARRGESGNEWVSEVSQFPLL